MPILEVLHFVAACGSIPDLWFVQVLVQVLRSFQPYCLQAVVGDAK